MDRQDWLKERMTGIGGSDAAAVLGLSKWKTPLEVFMEKRGELPAQPDNDAMLWGRLLEPVVRQRYSDVTGRDVRLPEGILRHPEHAFMLATIDGVVADEARLVEIKTSAHGDGWGEPGTDQVPQAYMIQVQHYLAVTALPVADVAVLIAGRDFRLYEVHADSELQALIIDEEMRFWRDLVAGIAPIPVTFADAQARYGRHSEARKVLASGSALEAVEHLREVRAQIKTLEAEEEQAKAVLMCEMGEADTLVDEADGALATWKASKPRVSFDTEAFKAAHPELYPQFLKTGEPSRRFLLK